MSIEADSPLDDMALRERAQIIQEAIKYSRRFRGSWFIVHILSRDLKPSELSQDLHLLRSLGIHVAIVIGEESYPDAVDVQGIELRKALNQGDIASVVLHWEETRSPGIDEGQQRHRWQEIAEMSSLVLVVRASSGGSLTAALTLAIESSAAKLLLLDRDWDPTQLPVGGPGSARPGPDDVRPYLRSVGTGALLLETIIEAVESGIDEAHIVPTAERAHPILVEIFTDTGIGTWLGP